jgi:hypothetical protein
VSASASAPTGGARTWAVVRVYLVERETLFARIREGRDLTALVLHMTTVSALFSALYGFTVGLYAGGWQVLYNAVKYPWLLLATFALCVLALYVLNSLLGARLSLLQTAAIVLSAILVTATLLLALIPPLGFLMLTSLREYHFVVFINMIVLCIAGAGGVSFAIQATAAAHRDPEVRQRCLKVMRGWMVLYGLVGAQMLWLFRPFFRQTDVFIRPLGEGGSVFEAAGRLLLHILRQLV